MRTDTSFATIDLANGPGEAAYFGMIMPDFNIRSEANPQVVLGRPIIGGLMKLDIASCYALRFTLDWNASNLLASLLASAVGKKAEYSFHYGIAISDQDWPLGLLPKTILIDSASLRPAVERVLSPLGIQVKRIHTRKRAFEQFIERDVASFQVPHSRTDQNDPWKQNAPQKPAILLTCRELHSMLTIAERSLHVASLNLKDCPLSLEMLAIERTPGLVGQKGKS